MHAAHAMILLSALATVVATPHVTADDPRQVGLGHRFDQDGALLENCGFGQLTFNAVLVGEQLAADQPSVDVLRFRIWRVNFGGPTPVTTFTNTTTGTGTWGDAWTCQGGDPALPPIGPRAWTFGSGDFILTVRAFDTVSLTNDTFMESMHFTVPDPPFTTMTAFEDATGTTAFEFILFPALAFLGIYIWSRSTDAVVRTFGALLVIIAGLVQVLLALELTNPWPGHIPIGTVLAIVGAYLTAKVGWDALTDPEAT